MAYSYDYGDTKNQINSYTKHRVRLGHELTKQETKYVIAWTANGQFQQLSGYGFKVSVSGDDSKSRTGVVSASGSSWTNQGTISDTVTVTRTHSSKTFKITAKLSGETVDGNTGLSGTSSVSYECTVPARPSYTVKYNFNGGSGTCDSQTKWYDESLTLREGGQLSRSGYTLFGWGTSSSDKTANYKLGGTYTSNTGTTLYALWKKTIKLSFNANGGSGAPSALSATVYNSDTSNTFTIPSTKPTRTGYTFLGWSKSSSATSSSYAAGSKITLSASDTLYAVWAIAKYTVTYNYNYSGSTSSSKPFNYNSNITLPTPTRTGYTFLGWYTASSGGTKLTTSYKVTSNITIYAQWKVATVICTFYTLNANGDYKATQKTLNISPSAQTVDASNITGKYNFIAWYPASMPTTKVYPANSGYEKGATIPSGCITYNNIIISSTSSNTIFYGVYKDGSPSNVTVQEIDSFRVNLQTTPIPTSINTLINNINDLSEFITYENSNGLFGYFQLSGPVARVQITSSTISGITPEVVIADNTVYFLYRGSFISTTKYVVNLIAYDSLGKSITGSCVFTKRSILLDISAITDSTKNVSGVVLNNRVNIKQGYQNGLNILDSNSSQVGDRASLYRDQDNNLLLGYDGYRGSVYSTYVTGNKLYLYSKNTIETNNDITIPNSYSYYSKNTGGTNRYLIRYNSNNNVIVGSSAQTSDYGSVISNSGGNTALYGYNILFYTGTGGETARAGYFSPNKNLNLDGQIAGLYKVITAPFSTGSIAAGGYVSAASRAYSGVPDGYNAVGIVGYATTHNAVRPTSNYVTSNTTIYCGFRNEGTSANSATITFEILCLKGTSA